MPDVGFPLSVVDGPGVNSYGNLGGPGDPLESQAMPKQVLLELVYYHSFPRDPFETSLWSFWEPVKLQIFWEALCDRI